MLRILLLSFLLLCIGSVVHAQKNSPPRPSQTSDTVRVVEVLWANRFDFKTVDSATQLQILVGKVKIRQGKTLFTCDSLVWNEKTNYMQAYGNVHINDADSVNIYSQYLHYDGTKKLATFTNKVKLTDGNSTLYTDTMDYDMNAKVGRYRDGGRIESKQTTLYSREGYYYADIKDVYFIGKVKMSDPEVALASDSLLYNTSSQVATFIAPTTIKSGNSIINTREGYYDLKLKKAKFGKRSRMQDSTTTMIADDFAFDDKTGYGEATGNVQYKDTSQGAMLFSNRVFFNKIRKNFLATEKPVMVIIKDKDSVFVAADTIYSGLMKDLALVKTGYIRAFDTLKGKTVFKVDSLLRKDSVSKYFSDSTIVMRDSLHNFHPDNIGIKHSDSISIAKNDSITVLPKINPGPVLKGQQPKKDPVTATNKLPFPPNKKTAIPDKDPIPVAKKDSIAKNDSVVVRKRSQEEIDTLRFITAFRHVRIFNDSLQAVADSMFYSGVDSIFELYNNPIVWAKESQVTGDTIFVYTVNRKPKRMYVYENGFMIQNVKESADFFNQVKGRTINGNFSDGEIDYVRAKGTAQSVYYAQDEDSSFLGMNSSSADLIDMYFEKRAVKKVKFVNMAQGTMFPIRKLPSDKKKLEGFQWLESRRPKSKLELFL